MLSIQLVVNSLTLPETTHIYINSHIRIKNRAYASEIGFIFSGIIFMNEKKKKYENISHYFCPMWFTTNNKKKKNSHRGYCEFSLDKRYYAIPRNVTRTQSEIHAIAGPDVSLIYSKVNECTH